MTSTVTLHAVDYVVIAVILLVSLAIGILFAVKDLRNANRVEYFLGGRRMSMLPVALSVFASFSSGISYVGATADVYYFGTMSNMVMIGISLANISAAFTLVPLFYPLRLTSLYEYLQMRFNSTFLRSMVLVFGMLQTLCYMAVALLAPALALQTGTGMPLWMSIGVMGFIVSVYTAIGGIKSVIWTDAFQSFIMLGGVLIIIFKERAKAVTKEQATMMHYRNGISIVGGGDVVWRLSLEGGRASLDQKSPDPRNRNTWLGSILGGVFLWMAFICNQSSLQRIASTKSKTDARNAFLVSSVIGFIQSWLLLAVGWVMYAYFATIRCDPFQAGHITSRNQLTVYFVMHALQDWPGIGGIFMATVFSGSLSTVSSGINALAANTMEDILKTPLRNLKESTSILVTKVVVFLYGILIIVLSYAASTVKSQLVPILFTGTGACASPVLGVFLLGALVPWGNKYGAIGGGLTAIVFTMWMAIGNLMYGRKWPTLPPAPSDMCYLNSSQTAFINGSSLEIGLRNGTLFAPIFNQTEKWNNYNEKMESNSYGFFLYDISYEWYSIIGTLVSLGLGTAISYCTRRYCVPATDERLLFPFVRKFWLATSFERSSEIVADNDAGKLMLADRKLNGDTVTKNEDI